MRGMLLVMALATMGGCAHGWNGGDGRSRDVRGSAQVGGGRPRLLLGGPALSVHTNVDGTEPVALFVVDQVNGDDRDCSLATASHLVAIAPEASRHVELAPGRELCAVSRKGSREVVWHGRTEDPTTMVAHK